MKNDKILMASNQVGKTELVFWELHRKIFKPMFLNKDFCTKYERLGRKMHWLERFGVTLMAERRKT